MRVARDVYQGVDMARLVAGLLLFAACAVSGTDSDLSTDNAPLVGVDGSLDQADRNCNVVLRELTRTGASQTTDSYVWNGSVEISSAAAAEGLVPSVLYQYGSNPAWLEGTVTPTVSPTPGFAKFAVQLDHDLLGPGMSATAFTNARIQVVPYMKLVGGGRLFDHNRNPRDLDNYVMTSPDLAIWRADSVCAAPSSSQHANLVFAHDFTQHRDGVISAGGTISVSYDSSRLATCNQTQGGRPQYDVTAHVKWLPENLEQTASVRDGAPTFTVPTDGAKQVQVWFEATSISGCHQYDSNYGANYAFDVAVAPQWIGNAKNLITRDADDPCDGGGAATSGFAFDTWARQRAVMTNLCFEVYQPGQTDRDDPQLWQKLDASIRWRIVGEPSWHLQPAGLHDRRGNNARYVTSWRPIDPFRPYQCPNITPTPSTNGMYRELRVEYVIVVNGSELRPEPGAAFVGTFSDYPSTQCP